MKIHCVIFGIVACAACGDDVVSTSVSVAVTDEPAGTNCVAGGDKIVVTDGSATETSYVCNGAAGTDGADGGSASVSVAAEPAGANCAAGGEAITTNSGGQSVTSYVCDGADGTSVVATAEPPGTNCAAGGTKLTDGAGAVTFVCNGAAGQSVTVTSEPAGSNCTDGGTELQVGSGAPEFACNGETLVWTSIAASTQGVRNFGYVSNAGSAILLTLPATSGLTIGDQLELVVRGTGSVSVTPNSGQLFAASGLAASESWTTSTLSRIDGVAISSDGNTVYAGTDQQITKSIDGGVTFTTTAAGNQSYGAFATSADGSVVIGVSFDGEPSAISTDGGATFAEPLETADLYTGVAMSADGTHILGASTEDLYVSQDRGATWVETPTGAPSIAYLSAAVSDTGTFMLAGAQTGQLFVSSNGGTSFAQVLSVSGAHWSSVAISSDGERMYAVDSVAHALSTSVDGGANWEQITLGESWSRVATVDDGTRVVATAGSAIFTSSDAGTTWTKTAAPSQAWFSLAVSGDASKIAAAAGSTFAINGTHALVAHDGAAVTLVYLGGGVFAVASSAGTIEAP